MLRSLIVRGALFAAVLGAVAAGRPAQAQDLNGAGATFPYPIYSKWFKAYHDANEGVNFNYQANGSGAGVALYKQGTVFFAASDAPLSDAEYASMPQPTAHIPTVAGSIVLAYNIKGVGPGLRLSGDVIADIYLGKITSWNDRRITSLNPGVDLPAQAITVAHRSDGSGTTYIYTHYLEAVSSEWASRVGSGKSVNWPVGIGANGNPGVAGIIRNQPGTVGYVELAYAIQNHLPFGPVKNRAGNFVLASIESTTEAANAAVARMKKDVRVSIVNGPGVNTYPIAGFTYMLVPKNPKDSAKGHALVGFLKWAMGPGQQMAETLLYAPLPASVVAINEHVLSQIH